MPADPPVEKPRHETKLDQLGLPSGGDLIFLTKQQIKLFEVPLLCYWPPTRVVAISIDDV